MSQLDWWEDEYCNRINGSDGAVFSPFVTKDKTLQMFIPGLCKSFKFTFESDELTVKDIPVLKYSISPSFFESGKTNPENRCYCKNPEDPESCTENGIFPLLGCGKGWDSISYMLRFDEKHMLANVKFKLCSCNGALPTTFLPRISIVHKSVDWSASRKRSS